MIKCLHGNSLTGYCLRCINNKFREFERNKKSCAHNFGGYFLNLFSETKTRACQKCQEIETVKI